MKLHNKTLKFPVYIMISSIAIVFVMAASCKKSVVPKPRSYFRIDFPKKDYIPYYSAECGYNFEIPVYAKVVPFKGSSVEPCWINITFPGYKGIIYITYKKMGHNLNEYVEDIHTLAYKHTIKADDIIEIPFSYPDRHVNGIIFNIKGNTASSLSFFATDSTDNFLSGALYFNVRPNKDSLAPVIKFFSADIEHLIKTLNWN